MKRKRGTGNKPRKWNRKTRRTRKQTDTDTGFIAGPNALLAAACPFAGHTVRRLHGTGTVLRFLRFHAPAAGRIENPGLARLRISAVGHRKIA
jgi:hypothetical protein